MKTLLIITTAILSVASSSSLSKYSAPHISNASTCFQDTVPKNRKTQNTMQGQAQQGQYKDIRTGKPLMLNYDRQRRMMMNTATGQPVDFYVDASTGDTISSYGYVVNNYLMMQPDSTYKLDMGRIRSTNNRYYTIQDNKELRRVENWPGNNNNNNNRKQGTRRDSL